MSRNPWRVGLVLLAVAVIAATGFCVFDTDGEHHDGAGLDLCTAMLATVAASGLLASLGVTGTTTERRRWAATPVTVSALDPPPWR